MTRVPFSEPDAPDEYVYSSAARIKCDDCGEYVYARRHVSGGPVFLPTECPVCAASLTCPENERG